MSRKIQSHRAGQKEDSPQCDDHRVTAMSVATLNLWNRRVAVHRHYSKIETQLEEGDEVDAESWRFMCNDLRGKMWNRTRASTTRVYVPVIPADSHNKTIKQQIPLNKSYAITQASVYQQFPGKYSMIKTHCVGPTSMRVYRHGMWHDAAL